MINRQELVDALEDESVLTYAMWRGWADEHALQETERRLEREEGAGAHGRPSPLAFLLNLLRGLW